MTCDIRQVSWIGTARLYSGRIFQSVSQTHERFFHMNKVKRYVLGASQSKAQNKMEHDLNNSDLRFVSGGDGLHVHMYV